MNISVFVPKGLHARQSNNYCQELTPCETCHFVPNIDSDITPPPLLDVLVVSERVSMMVVSA